MFEVEYVEPDYPDGPGGDDGLSFQEDLEKVERKVWGFKTHLHYAKFEGLKL